jgi:hypothetical protein
VLAPAAAGALLFVLGAGIAAGVLWRLGALGGGSHRVTLVHEPGAVLPNFWSHPAGANGRRSPVRSPLLSQLVAPTHRNRTSAPKTQHATTPAAASPAGARSTGAAGSRPAASNHAARTAPRGHAGLPYRPAPSAHHQATPPSQPSTPAPSSPTSKKINPPAPPPPPAAQQQQPTGGTTANSGTPSSGSTTSSSPPSVTPVTPPKPVDAKSGEGKPDKPAKVKHENKGRGKSDGAEG